MSVRVAAAVLMIAATAGRARAATVDDIVLTVDKGPGAGEVTLRWTGGTPLYSVFRSTDPAGLTDSQNLIGQTSGESFIDAPPPGTVFFYAVTGTGCASDAGCPTGHCVDTYCCDTACSGTCEACNLPGSEGTCLPIPAGQDPAGECGPGAVCDGSGGCASLNGSGCTSDSECLSGFCVDGFCCDAACDGVCEACNVAGSIGTCTAVPAGTDPSDECPVDPPSTCGRTGVCSGNGSCSLYTAGTVCAGASCASSTSANVEDTCDGVGGCTDNGVQDCTPYVCGPSGTCGTDCATNDDCAGGFYCDPGPGQCLACSPQPDVPDLDFVDTNCDGIDGDASAAVFVDTVTGNDANDGTMAQPKRSITAAINAAAASGKDVYISKGTYNETIVLADGVGLYGGYDRANGWSRGTTNTTTIVGGATAVRGDHLIAATELQLLSIVAQSATTPGNSSYGILLVDSTDVTVRACIVQAGGGASGNSGSDGTPATGGGSGALGGPGCENGTLICSTCSQPQGGAGGTSACGRAGGQGGNAGLGTSYGSAGQPGAGGTTAGLGAPPGQGDWNPPPSYGGANGTDGSDGSDGPAGSGNFTASGYSPVPGGNGSAGTPGNGGGGGGGGGGGTVNCDSYGGAGGGGGAGGCGGGPATGGRSGGGSFAIYLWASTAQIDSCTLTAGPGGSGGAGGTGGAGSSGGSGASNPSLTGAGNLYGGSAEQDDGSNGGRGGDGGGGGRGGHGGGGAGGPSIGIACEGGSSITNTGNTFTLGGGGGGGYSPGASGPTGVTTQTHGC